jgi:hypothetical protein
MLHYVYHFYNSSSVFRFTASEQDHTDTDCCVESFQTSLLLAVVRFQKFSSRLHS